jgi:hypothetical protein
VHHAPQASKESRRLSGEDFALRPLIDAPATKTTRAAASEKHHLKGKLAGKKFTSIAELIVAPARVRAGRGSRGENLYRIRSIAFDFFEPDIVIAKLFCKLQRSADCGSSGCDL